ADNLGEFSTYVDTGLYLSHRYLPATRIPMEYGTTGVPGGAAIPLFWEPYNRRGVDLGFHQYDLYFNTASDLRFFKTEKGFTHAKFSPGNEQADSKVDLVFSKEFDNGINLALEHHRITMGGTTFRFQRQQHRHSDFQIGLAYNPERSNYKSFLTYSSNYSEVQNNGGITEESVIAERPFEESVRLTNANTLNRWKEIQYTQYLGFFGKAKNEGNPRAYTLAHTFNYTWASFKFSDNSPNSTTDTSYYEGFPIDDRGLRYSLGYSKLSNKVTVQTFRNRSKNQRDFFEAGALFDNHTLDFDNGNEQRNNLFLLGRWHFQPKPFLQLKTYGHFGLADNAGDYKIQGDLLLDFGDWGKLEGLFINQLTEPTIVEERFSINFEDVWQNDFKKTLNTTIGGTLTIPKLGLTGGVHYHLVNNLVYFDTLGFPRQTSVPTNILQISIESKLKLWKFHLDNTFGLQTLSESYLQLPTYFSRHMLYFKDDIFKDRLRFQMGLDGRIYSQWKPMGYLPLTGQFHQQNDFTAMAYPQIDLFIALKVEKFVAFFNFENALSYLGDAYVEEKFGSRYFYQVADYPFPNRTFRWGISWVFSN
ncbi:MAG: hypothetical protein KDC24_12385, partial [Saprospiraceae bacterium]|nr:hypothetical protein [Saprospiraceae bacterium]